MKNNLNKLDKYLGERVKVTVLSGKIYHLKILSCSPDYIKGFDDERMNIQIKNNRISKIEVMKK